LTSTEIYRALNEFMSLYPNYYKNQSRESMERVAQSWMRKFDKVTDYNTFIDALYEFEQKSDYPNPPTTKQMLDLYRTVKMRKASEKGQSGRRIETPEEVAAQIFHQEMEKPREKRNYDLLERTKYYAGLFQDDEAYKKHFGKYREEYEKY